MITFVPGGNRGAAMANKPRKKALHGGVSNPLNLNGSALYEVFYDFDKDDYHGSFCVMGGRG
jgi:hypothetical protein